MPDYGDVPDGILHRLRSVCLALPDAYEEPAWTGTRWRIRKRTFAHVLALESRWPAAYVRAVPVDGPVTVLTFRSHGVELEVLRRAGPPFFAPEWSPAVVGLVIEDDVDWEEVTELLTESYCTLAPRKLAALVQGP